MADDEHVCFVDTRFPAASPFCTFDSTIAALHEFEGFIYVRCEDGSRWLVNPSGEKTRLESTIVHQTDTPHHC